MVSPRSRAALENVDVAAATFVVGSDLVECDFLSIQEAINNAPSAGADIYVLPGTYTMPAGLVSVDRPITIGGSGIDVTILDFGAVSGKFIAVDHDAPVNLLNLTVWAGNVAGQYLYDISTSYLGTQIIIVENVIIGRAGDATKSIEGVFLGAAYAQLMNVGAILQITANSYFSDSGAGTPGLSYIICYDVGSIGTGTEELKWGGFKNEAGIFCSESLFGCANFGSAGFVASCDQSRFVGAGGASTLTVGSFSSFSDTSLNDVAITFAAATRQVTIVSCISGTLYTSAQRYIDIPDGVSEIAISGCSLGQGTVDTIRNGGTKVSVSGCVGAGSDILVTEIGNADNNAYWNIDAASVIVGASTTVNGSKLNTFIAVTTNAFVSMMTLVNPRGLQGIGTIENKGGFSMDVKELFTDASGTSTTVTTTVVAGDRLLLSLGITVGLCQPPYVSYEVQIKDTVNGSHTTPELFFTSQGAML